VGANVGISGIVVDVIPFSISAANVWATSVRMAFKACSMSSGDTVGDVPGILQAAKNAIKIILKYSLKNLISNSFCIWAYMVKTMKVLEMFPKGKIRESIDWI